MSRNILLMGAGSLGSGFALELAKRLYALGDTGLFDHVLVVDNGNVEARNVAAQLFTPSHIGLSKAIVVADLLNEFGVHASYSTDTIGYPAHVLDHIEALGGEVALIVDAMDNVPTRHAIWYAAQAGGHTILHLGMDERGSGVASWSDPNHETFALSPIQMSEADIKAASAVDVSLKPCELTVMRGLIINTYLSGVNAALMYFGIDTESVLVDEEGRALEVPGIMPTFFTQVNSREFVPQLTGLPPEEELPE